MLRLAVQAAGPIGQNFLCILMGGRGMFLAKKIKNLKFKKYFNLIFFSTGNAEPFS